MPFAFPHSPDIGKGLTDIGLELIKHCNDLKMIVDTSHLNEKGFWDIAKNSIHPLVATHSNAHIICPHTRNLTNKQLDAIRKKARSRADRRMGGGSMKKVQGYKSGGTVRGAGAATRGKGFTRAG